MVSSRQPDQAKTNERRRGKIEALNAIVSQDARQPLLAGCRVQQRQVDAAPLRLGLRHDDLHRSVRF